MYVILTYDVNKKRVSKTRKICKKYLKHIQKSVFEGTITEAMLKRLKGELQKVIDSDEDQIAIYEFESLKYTHKEVIGLYDNYSSIL